MGNNEESKNKVCLSSFKAHWAQAQIDGPMQTIARYDDVAKLLITIGGFLLAVLAAGYSVMIRDLRGKINVDQARTISTIVFVSMLVFFLSAAAVCFPQPQIRASKILELENDDALNSEIADWCENLRKVILKKRIFLGVSTFSFIISFLVMMLLMLSLM